MTTAYDPLEYIREHYHVPAEVGRRVKCYNQLGTITGGRNAYISVTHDDGRRGLYHPTHGVQYLDEVTPWVPKRKTKRQLRYQEFLRLRDCYGPDFTFREFITNPYFKEYQT